MFFPCRRHPQRCNEDDEKQNSDKAARHQAIALQVIMDSIKGEIDKATNESVKLTETEENYRLTCLRLAADYFYQMDNNAWADSIAEFKEQTCQKKLHANNYCKDFSYQSFS